MEALVLTRKDFEQGVASVEEACNDSVYLAQFEVKFPAGLNTASTLEICRLFQNPTLENKVHIMRLCIKGKNVEVKCPNGETEKFCMSNLDDNLEGFPLFMKEPLALLAIADNIYGYLLKKYVRLSKARTAASNKAE